ncbi:hypothetical protein F5B20DRAFT_594626 [Whalleya microplaca]|nr:hypothetical protein F5B20DRAFT_594626 [Whalleya microplaca]
MSSLSSSAEAEPSNRGSSTPEPLVTPYRPHPQMSRPREHSTMLRRINEGKSTSSGSEVDDFYTDEDLRNHSPRGLPSAAATQMYFPNFNSHRGFDSLTHRVLDHMAMKIWCIEDKIDKMDIEDETAGGQALRSLPFNREQFIARCLRGTGLSSGPPGPDVDLPDRVTQKDNLVISSEIMLRDYFSLLHQHHATRKLAKVSRRALEVHFRTMRDFQGLDNEACAFMRYMDDFVTTEPDHIFQRFESLLYTLPRVVTFIKNLSSLFHRTRTRSPSSTSSPTNTLPLTQPPTPTPSSDLPLELSLRGFERAFRLLLGMAGLLLLLPPISVLYLAELSKPGYFAVVVACAGVFVVALTAIEERSGHFLVGLCTYFAVLVTFLSNLQG